jgi:hypothetical protein
MFLFLLITQSPNRKKLSFKTLSLFSFLPIIFVVIVFFVLFILSNHSFHYFHTSLEWSRIPSSSLTMLLLFLFVASFLIIFIFFFKLLDVGIPDLPLSYLSTQIISDGRASGSSSLLNGRTYSLCLSIFIVEFIFHSLFNSFNIFSWARFFLLSLPFDLFKFSFADILDFLLDFVFVWTSMDVVSFEGEMHN